MKSNIVSDLIHRRLSQRAKRHGYALGVHGSLVRDIDLICVPWQRDVSSVEEVAEAIRQECANIFGEAVQVECSQYFKEGSPGSKPHGRRVWSFHLAGGSAVSDLPVYIDLSVMQPRTLEEDNAEFNRIVERNSKLPEEEVGATLLDAPE